MPEGLETYPQRPKRTRTPPRPEVASVFSPTPGRSGPKRWECFDILKDKKVDLSRGSPAEGPKEVDIFKAF